MPTTGKGKGHGRPKLTDEEKLEKHRMIVRRSYYQKKACRLGALKARLKADIDALELQYKELMMRANANAALSNATSHCTCCQHPPCVRVLYRALSVKKEQLRAQNDTLEEQILSHLNFHDKVSFLAARQLETREQNTTMTTTGIVSIERGVLQAYTDEFSLSFQPLTEEECFATIREVQRDIASQRSSSIFRQAGAPVMGWNRMRTYGPDAKFSLLKRFDGESAVNLADRTWTLYTESDHFVHLYSGCVNMRFQLLQRVNANNALFYRSLTTELLKFRCLTFFQLSRLQVDNKHFIIFCSIDPARIQTDLDAHHMWLEMFSWLCFSDYVDDAGTQYCEMEFGGNVPSATVADTEFWMMEFVSYLLRFENRMIHSVFSLDFTEGGDQE
uniref:BZIP domain-containing protein n=1 Tax=Globisporangium ultimum (strain ATCC 200006 / CBS 805.95 / DAOM BR144) TaxID=431595 RepID=K3WNP9_GLOUD